MEAASLARGVIPRAAPPARTRGRRATDTVESADIAADTPREARVRTVPLIAFSVALVALAAGVLWWTGREPAPPPPAQASIAVLPFKSLSDDPQDSHFAEGLADELLDALAGVESLQVAARHATLALGDLEPRAIGERLGVATVLSANLRRMGDRVRISAQLSDTRSGFVLWSRSFDHKLTDIFTVQRQIASEVVNALLGAMPHADGSLEERLTVTGDANAYAAYLQGRQSLIHGGSEKAMTAAIDLFNQALEADADFARAQSGLCLAEVRRFEALRDTSALGRAQAACERAAEMDPTLREVNLARGQLLRVQGESERAVEEFTRALDEPLLRADAYIGLAMLEAAAGRDALALEYFARTQAADPGYWRGYFALGNFHFARGNTNAASDAYRTAIGLAPDDATSPWNNLGALYLRQADFEPAAEAFQRSLDIEPTQSALSNLATLRYYLGEYAEASDLLLQALDAAPMDFRVHGNLGDALASQPGMESEALAAYRRAADMAETWLREQPEDAEGTAALAWYLANLGDAEGALVQAERAHSLAPDQPHVAVWLAQVYARLGDDARARILLNQARSGGVPARLLAALPALKHLEQGPRTETGS